MLFVIEAGVRYEQADMPVAGYWYDDKIYEIEYMSVEGDGFTNDELVGGNLPETLVKAMMKANDWVNENVDAPVNDWGHEIQGVGSGWVTEPVTSGKVKNEVFRYWYEGMTRIHYLRLSWEPEKVKVTQDQREAMERITSIDRSVDGLRAEIRCLRAAFSDIEDLAVRDQRVYDGLTASKRITLGLLINFSRAWTPDGIEVEDDNV